MTDSKEPSENHPVKGMAVDEPMPPVSEQPDSQHMSQGHNKQEAQKASDDSPGLSLPQHSAESSLKVKSTNNDPGKVSVTSSSKKSGSMVGIVFAVIVFVAFGGLGYACWLQYQQLNTLNQVVASQAEQLTQLGTVSTKTQQELSGIATQQAEQLVSSQEQNRVSQEALTNLREHVFNLTATTSDDWKLAEAHYLTRLAGQRLLMEHDTEAALALLQTADTIVKNRADPALYKVREQFADDMAALKLAGDVDKEGMFLSLSAIGKVISVLPKPIPDSFQSGSATPVASETITPEIDPEQLPVWERIKYSFRRAFGSLQGHIRITRSKETIDSLLSTEAQSFLKTSLRLNIESAQWALLREQSPVYRESLNRVIELLQRYYPLSAEAGKLSEQLRLMREQNIVQQLPDISGSQLVLSDYLERLHKVQQASPSAVEKKQ